MLYAKTLLVDLSFVLLSLNWFVLTNPDVALEREAEGDLILGDMGQVSQNSQIFTFTLPGWSLANAITVFVLFPFKSTCFKRPRKWGLAAFEVLVVGNLEFLFHNLMYVKITKKIN